MSIYGSISGSKFGQSPRFDAVRGPPTKPSGAFSFRPFGGRGLLSGARGLAGCLWGAVLAGGCAAPLGPGAFASTTPAFDPVTFWAGQTASWGVIENRDGAPTAIITTTTDSVPEGPDGLHMVQQVVHDGQDTTRDWHFRRVGRGQFEATANDLVGTARGATSGRTLHWTWTLATRPGGGPFDGLFDVTMDQWMYLADDGTLMNRTLISKLGVRLAEVSEQFVRGRAGRPTAVRP